MSPAGETVIVHYFLQLPIEISRSIFNEYLKEKSKYSLLQTTEKFNLLRKQIIYLKLRRNESEKFYLNRGYRERVLSCIESPQYQLHLGLDKLFFEGDGSSAIDLGIVLPVHRLQVNFFAEIINFHLIGSNKPDLLEINHCNSSIDIEHCNGISTLSLSLCSKIENIDKFSDIKVCKLRSCPINPMEWSMFSSIQVFELFECGSITDVSALAHISDLTLGRCQNITNIDALTHNNSLTIDCCVNIETISLSDHPRDEVKIRGVFNLLELTIAGTVRKVQLDSLPSLSQISLLDYVIELNIEEADSLISLDNVPYVQSISLVRCVSLEEISPLLQVKSLEMDECVSVKSIKSLQFLENLKVYTTEDLRSIEDLPLLTSLKFRNCDGIEKIANLPVCTNYEVFLSVDEFEEFEVVNCPGYVKPTFQAE